MPNKSGPKRSGRKKDKPAAATSGTHKDRAPIEFPAGIEPVPAPAAFDELCDGFGLAVSPDEREKLGRYVGLLLAANELMNLTAIRDPEEAWARHVFDSLTVISVLEDLRPEGDVLRVIDVGAGGGLPTIPLAVGAPGAGVTAVEATAKKCAFIAHAARELGLDNVEVENARAEGAGRDRRLRGAADVGVCRALGRLAVASELVMPLVRVGGVGVFIKGERAEEELAEAERGLGMLGCAHAGTFETPTGRLVVIERERPCPKPYPRSDGLPKKEPLGVPRAR